VGFIYHSSVKFYALAAARSTAATFHENEMKEEIKARKN
jgi:hypothetical protein